MCRTPFIKLNDKAFSLVDSAETIVLNGVPHGHCISKEGIFSLSGYKRLDIRENYCHNTLEEITDFMQANYVTFQGVKFKLFCTCPCGKCDECHYNRVTEFESRILMEAASFPEMYFFTTTYDDAHLPPEGLRKSDMVAFNKRLRFWIFKELGLRVRLVYVGEYGSRTHRPHYHGLIFFERPMTMQERIKFMDIFFHRKSFREAHPRARNVWPHGYRRDLQFCKSPAASARYLSKYVSKQYLSKPELSCHYTPEFIQTPRGCALGCTNIQDYAPFMEVTNTGSLKLCICGEYSTVKFNRVLIDKVFPNFSHFVKSYKHTLSEFRLMHECITKRGLGWFPDDIVNDAYFHVQYLDNIILTKRQVNRNLCMRKFIARMTDDELCENLLTLANKIIHSFPMASEYYALLLKKQNFYDRICNSELDLQTLQQEKQVKLRSRLDYVNRRMMCSPTLE